MLPERRMNIHVKPIKTPETPIVEEQPNKSGKENALFAALLEIEQTLFYSAREDRFKEIDMSNNIVAQTLDYLFSNNYTKIE